MDEHIHESRDSRDCDGRYERDDVITEFNGETGRNVWREYMRFVIGFSSPYWTDPEWTLDRWTEDDGVAMVEYGGPTDEGYRWTTARTCRDVHCAAGTSRYRDHTAESMGY